MTNTSYFCYFNGVRFSECETLSDAMYAIETHAKYKKTWFTKRGKASSRNPNEKDRFMIVDNNGGLYYIRN